MSKYYMAFSALPKKPAVRLTALPWLEDKMKKVILTIDSINDQGLSTGLSTYVVKVGDSLAVKYLPGTHISKIVIDRIIDDGVKEIV